MLDESNGGSLRFSWTVFVAATGLPKNALERSSSEAHSQRVSAISVPGFQDGDGVGCREASGYPRMSAGRQVFVKVLVVVRN